VNMKKKEPQEKRFVTILREGSGPDWRNIILDMQTGVQYLWVTEYYKGGLTVLVDKDGNPLLADPSADK